MARKKCIIGIQTFAEIYKKPAAASKAARSAVAFEVETLATLDAIKP